MKKKDMHIRLSEQEFNLIKQVAEQEFMTASQLIRKLVFLNINK